MSDDESGGGMGTGASSVAGSTEAGVAEVEEALPPLTEVWDCEQISLGKDANGNDMWLCRNCPTHLQKYRKGKNATKVLQGHLIGIPKLGISKCESKIDPRYMKRYVDLYTRKCHRKEMRKEGKEKLAAAIGNTQETVLALQSPSGSVASSIS